jgi:(1->4)-alpha-D-glucan 1-alpha-D-glucosylmutase
VRVPTSTYRLQFGPGFGFEDARRLVPYLASLGIGDLYSSPLFAAATGSTHGYDVIDPTRLNAELGPPETFEAMVEELGRHGMGLLLDIVPNHMAMSSENSWWMDVLENGQASAYASFFDIDWRAPGLEGKVVVPVLAAPYGETLEKGELWLALEPEGIFVRYFDHRFPVDPGSYRHLLEHRLDRLEEELGAGHAVLRKLPRLLGTIRNLPSRTLIDPESRQRRSRDGRSIKRRLKELLETHPEMRAFVERNVREWGGAPVSERRVELLDRLIGEQAYLLSYWRVAPEEIDYRRFFDIADLVALRQDDPEVFEATHALVLELVRQEKVTGLRVDHVDGLLDPVGYLRRLREGAGSRCYVAAEKILAEGEDLPEEWPIAGTTGYEFANAANGLFVDPDGVASLARAAAKFTGLDSPFEEVGRAAKQKVMAELFGSEVQALAARLQRLARQDRHARDLTRSELTRALVEVTSSLDVYRTYIRDRNVRPTDRARIVEAVHGAERRLPAEAGPALDFLRRVLLLELSRRSPGDRVRAWTGFVMRWQQFSGAVMAKGLEDTAMYAYNPLVSRNEVGGDPGRPPTAPAEFHRKNRARLRAWPHALSATSTHDTKRSEDVRSRIDVLSEMPDEWAGRVIRWNAWNHSKKREVGGRLAPDPNDELLLYQTLVGVWPSSKREEHGLTERLKEYMLKAVREAKTHTSWIDPNPDYEAAATAFVQAVAAPSNRRFRKDLLEVVRTVALHGAVNSLSQVVLKVASPGVPDFYQGTESWSLRLVDPDNRRLPEFARLSKQLDGLERVGGAGADQGAEATELLEKWQDGRIKLLVTSRALAYRRAHRGLFDRGSYRALSASGRWNDHVVAFARQRGRQWAIAIVPRLTMGRSGPASPPVGKSVWGSGALALPARAPERWINALTGESLLARSRRGRRVMLLAEVFASFPVALLGREQPPQGTVG